jgi:hypothetical protein
MVMKPRTLPSGPPAGRKRRSSHDRADDLDEVAGGLGERGADGSAP